MKSNNLKLEQATISNDMRHAAILIVLVFRAPVMIEGPKNVNKPKFGQFFSIYPVYETF